MNKLEEIKEAIAKEKGFEDYSELLFQNAHSFGDLDGVITDIVHRYTNIYTKNLVYLIVYEDNYDSERPLAACSDRETAERVLSALTTDRTCAIVEYEINKAYTN